jgi:hypothetical protein
MFTPSVEVIKEWFTFAIEAGRILNLNKVVLIRNQKSKLYLKTS